MKPAATIHHHHFRPGRKLSLVWAFALVCFAVLPVLATNHLLRQDEIMTGFKGDATVQFIEITVGDGSQKAWGPQGGESNSRAMLVFFDGAGNETGRFFFPSNAPVGGNTVLIATAGFAALPGAPVPDFIMPPLLNPDSGKVCLRGNPANARAFDVNLCLSYGSFPEALTEGAGPSAPALPGTGVPTSLTRFQNFTHGSSSGRNADFALATPTPVNTAGQTFLIPVDGPEIAFIPASLNFGQRDLTAGPGAAMTVTITNRGTLNPLVITNLSVTGIHSNQFNLLSSGGGGVLPPGGTRVVSLNFDPDSAGTKVAVLRVQSNDADESVAEVALLGIGIDPNAPEINVTPLVVDMGIQNVAAGSTAPRMITVTNQSSFAPLQLGGFFLTGPQADQFAIVSVTNVTSVQPAGAIAIMVAFDPTTAGPKSAVLRILSDDADEGVVDVSLQGRAFDLNPCVVPNPPDTVAQNSCTNAQLLCPGAEFVGKTFGATPDGSAACGSASADVWFRYVPSADGTLAVTVTGSGFSPTVSAHRGCPGTAANQFACATSLQQTQGFPARISFAVSNGVEVLLRVAGNSTSVGTFRLNLSGPPCFDFDRNRNGVTDGCEFDFGDAPAAYPTTLAANGARHRAFTPLFLGRRVDPNDDGLPSPRADGDNLDGAPNDDDGVAFASSVVPGSNASLRITASGQGLLNAWIDFNADGDWADAGEQIFTNQPVAAGTNLLTFTVPSAAQVTNLTFARFRLSSEAGLGVTGPANDGEVEDYALEISAPDQTPSTVRVRFNEVMAGLNGDSTVQFVELEVEVGAHKLWGPQGAETAGRTMLAFYDAAGRLSGRFVFPSNAPSGGTTVLVATRAFAELTGLTPDFVMPPEVVPIAGKVVFQTNPDNPQFAVNIALSYGGAEYFGGTDGAGPAAVDALPILGAHSLGRTPEVPFGVNQNQAFTIGVPSPRNTAGGTVSMAPVPLAEQGRMLFMHETFRGNGRTCATCHVPGRDQFGLTPLTIAELDEDDPLFVFEANVNRLRLAGRSQPGDLRGTVSGGIGSARILSGSGDSYLVIGGAELGGTITDAAGNHATFVSWTPGDLEGPTASNGSVRGLEDHQLLEHGRGLILENIDGFRRGEVFRASPHLLNLGLTAPFGLSGEFGNLEDFSEGAVAQHFPKSLARRSGVDFRTPTREELEAMTAFMLGISNPSTNDLNLDRLATTEAQKRGRALFFGDEGRCAKCHSGPVLALSDGSLTNSVKGRNENFNTGVANLLRNLPAVDNLPTEPAGLVPGRSTRAFNTPSLFNIRLTAPYFHDGSAETLTEAVRFYDSEEFNASPTGREIGSLLAANRPEKIADLVAFLEALIELPVDFQRELAFGVRCPGESPPGTLTVGVTNISAHFITITNVFINGTNAADFALGGDTGGTILAPGAVRQVVMAFQPQAPGLKRATLEFGGWDTNSLGRLDFGVALSGGDIDNVVQVTPVAVGFATRDIDAPPSPGVFIVITNNGSTELALARIGLSGTNAADFIFQMETNVVPPHGSRVGTVSFAPGTQGVKTAVIRGGIISCNTNRIEIPLTGEASSTVHHFDWDALAPTQFVGVPFPVRVAAVDRNGETVPSFNGSVNLFTVVGSQTNTTFATPTNSTPFILGVWNGDMTAIRQATTMRLLARDDAGHTGISTAFAAPLRDDLSLTVLDVPDPVLNGGNLTYVFSVNNTGPATATGVVLTNVLPGGVNFKSGTNNLGSFVHAGGMVTWSIGTLGPAVTAVLSLTVEPAISAGGTTLLNVASVSRNEPEFVVGNNTVTNTTLCGAFGSLVVLPDTNFFSTALSGALFTPSSHALVLSNNGTASLNWQVLEADSPGGGWTTLTPSSGSLAAGSSTNVSLAFTDSASDQLPPGLYTNTMVFTNLSGGRGTTDRKIGVGVINRRPTLKTPLAITVLEDSGVVEFEVSDILPGGREIQNLTVTATSGNPALIPNPIRVTFSNSLPTATIAFTPATNAYGSTLLRVVLRDDGGTILGGIDASTNDVSITVLPVNDAPVLLPPSDRLASPGATVGFNVVATDVDLPSDHLTFALEPGAAPGAVVNPVSGFFSWVVPVASVPSTNRFTLTVTDDGSPALGDSRSFSIVVFPQPVIESVRRTNSTVQLTWSSVPGTRYRVQWKARLENAEWMNEPGEIVASVGSATWAGEAPSNVRRFYRVSVVP